MPSPFSFCFFVQAICLDYCLANKGRARERKLNPVSLDLVIQLSLSVSQLSTTLAISLQSCYAGLYSDSPPLPRSLLGKRLPTPAFSAKRKRRSPRCNANTASLQKEPLNGANFVRLSRGCMSGSLSDGRTSRIRKVDTLSMPMGSSSSKTCRSTA